MGRGRDGGTTDVAGGRTRGARARRSIPDQPAGPGAAGSGLGSSAVGGAPGVRTTTGVPSASWVWPVVTTCARAGSLPRTSTQPGPSRPVSTAIARAVSPSTTNSLVTPANLTTDSIGTTVASELRSVRIVASANPPGRSIPRLFGTTASTWNVRLTGSTAGLIRVTLPSTGMSGYDATRKRTSWPTWTSAPNRSGTL